MQHRYVLSVLDELDAAVTTIQRYMCSCSRLFNYLVFTIS